MANEINGLIVSISTYVSPHEWALDVLMNISAAIKAAGTSQTALTALTTHLDSERGKLLSTWGKIHPTTQKH